MNTLDRLKELNAGNEWDFNDLGFLVNALPALIAVAEAAVEYNDVKRIDSLTEDERYLRDECGFDVERMGDRGKRIDSAKQSLDAALANLEVDAHED